MMRTRLPASRGALRVRVSVFDTVWAFASPPLALLFRDAYILSYEHLWTALLYCVLSAAFSLMAFLIFRLHDGLARYFSVHDALDVLKAVICAEFMTSVVFFSFTRLEGIPRPTPLVHALILLAGLITARVVARLFDERAKPANGSTVVASENIIMIGATQLTSLYIKLLGACSPGHRRVLAVLDDRTQSTGRAMAGVRILATTEQLECIIDEFVVHGLQTDRVIVGGEADLLSDAGLKEIRRLCGRREIKLDFVPQLIGLGELQRTSIAQTLESEEVSAPNFELPRYFEIKPLMDFFVALAMTIFFPVLIFAAVVVLLDVGTPLLFWQQRIGKGGRNFLLLKFRTLRPPSDWRGQPIPEEQRLSRVGRLLRQSRLDELPQLLNVLVGDMSLIGPRPLLPEDQPTNPTTRLLVRPGITGWAQVNGGKFLTPQEKDEFDEYYIRNASVGFDLRIAFMTLKVLFRRNAQSDHEVAATFGGAARIERAQPVHQMPLPKVRLGTTRLRDKELPPLSLGAVHVSPAPETLPGRKSGNHNG
jgi:lipopolysaccharide/colanic/teichoic acid biosynthesis glycosyltransferase